ncbi:MAG: hypothetical protein JO001_01275 [Alphaproteobacteria bacterium]|nr:hypothetical protein [Alphaproteobacteria bacterium]
MPDDIALTAFAQRPESRALAPHPPPSSTALLPKLESGARGKRGTGGAIALRRQEPAGCFLYGPYLHLRQGSYRMTIRCSSRRARMLDQPVLGVEVIILSRFQLQWCDFTQAELADGVATIDFSVPFEHSLESENEGRFEFRFYHFENADIEITDVKLDPLPPSGLLPDPKARTWRMLGRLQKGWFGRRVRSGSVRTAAWEPIGCIVYGGWPYLRLPRARYRLTVRADLSSAAASAASLLGVEVQAQSRWRTRSMLQVAANVPATNGIQLLWREFDRQALADGVMTLDFVVPTEIGLEAGADAPIDIRLHRLAAADLTIHAVDVRQLCETEPMQAKPSAWYLMREREMTGRDCARGVVRRWLPPLPAGHYRLRVKASVPSTASRDAPALTIEVAARPNFAEQPQSLLRPALTARTTITVGEVARDAGGHSFAIPDDMALGVGNLQSTFTLREAPDSGVSIAEVTLLQELEELPAKSRAQSHLVAPMLRPTGRRKIVIIGNCQSETLRQGFTHTESLNKLYEVKYHFVQLQKNLHEFAALDLETCDVVLAQDIKLWDEFPLRDHIRPGAEVIRFPLVRFASLWPFDAWNGPGDKLAYESEAPNLTFPYLDGLLGRLRTEVPDKQARFDAYRDLEHRGIVNYRRLHDMEVKRLASVDRKFGIDLGSFILDNFQKRQLFHTTVRPNWEVFGQMIEFAARQVGAPGPVTVNESIDTGLRNPQVPIHPKVARDLGVGWATESRLYLNRGREISWETYIQEYIHHYG